MDADLRPCPFCAHDKPVVERVPGQPLAYVVTCPECGAMGPKQLAGVPLALGVDAWNRRHARDHLMPALCPICHWAAPQLAYLADSLTAYLRCLQGVPGAPLREACGVFLREPGADDEQPHRQRGRLPTLYPQLTAI